MISLVKEANLWLKIIFIKQSSVLYIIGDQQRSTPWRDPGSPMHSDIMLQQALQAKDNLYVGYTLKDIVKTEEGILNNMQDKLKTVNVMPLVESKDPITIRMRKQLREDKELAGKYLYFIFIYLFWERLVEGEAESWRDLEDESRDL